jgi:hypothetical protein
MKATTAGHEDQSLNDVVDGEDEAQRGGISPTRHQFTS